MKQGELQDKIRNLIKGMSFFTWKTPFFLLSIVIAVVAFMIANEKDVPFVSQIVFRRVNSLEIGFNDVCGLPIGLIAQNDKSFRMIKGDLKLGSGEEGFNELSQFLMNDLRRRQPKAVENSCCGEIKLTDLAKTINSVRRR